MRAFSTGSGFVALGFSPLEMLLCIVAATFAIALTGCKEEEERIVPEARIVEPATESAGAVASTAPKAPATVPATTRAAVESLINIDGNLVLFPAAKMRLDESDGKTVARLFSDDPKGAALDENYDGNSFYLQIELDADDVKTGDALDLDGMQLTYRAPTSERDDSPYGIFLEGRRWALQPADVRVAFEGTGSPLDVRLTGTFLMFDTNDDAAKPRYARVFAELSASVQSRK